MFKIPTKIEKFNVIVIGTGGTGGYFIENAMRLLNAKEAGQLTIVDGDTVEQKNLLRQNFYQNDLGINKAIALYKRLHPNYPETTINIANNYLTKGEELLEMINFTKDFPIIVSCVDNNATRHLIKDALSDEKIKRPFVWLDAGNGERSGQVVAATHNVTKLDLGDEIPEGFAVSENTDAIDCFPEAFANTDHRPDELSCADHSLESPQDIAANITSANTLFVLINKIINHEFIQEHIVKFNTLDSRVTVE